MDCRIESNQTADVVRGWLTWALKLETIAIETISDFKSVASQVSEENLMGLKTLSETAKAENHTACLDRWMCTLDRSRGMPNEEIALRNLDRLFFYIWTVRKDLFFRHSHRSSYHQFQIGIAFPMIFDFLRKRH